MGTGTDETRALVRAAGGLGEMDPMTAWDLDAQLAGLSNGALAMAENVGQYVETLNNLRTDPRVTAQAGQAVAQLAELVATFAAARKTFRALYAPQFEAAESGVRQVERPGFWNQSNSAA
jgi:hypothetical protein